MILLNQREEISRKYCGMEWEKMKGKGS